MQPQTDEDPPGKRAGCWPSYPGHLAGEPGSGEGRHPSSFLVARVVIIASGRLTYHNCMVLLRLPAEVGVPGASWSHGPTALGALPPWGARPHPFGCAEGRGA